MRTTLATAALLSVVSLGYGCAHSSGTPGGLAASINHNGSTVAGGHDADLTNSVSVGTPIGDLWKSNAVAGEATLSTAAAGETALSQEPTFQPAAAPRAASGPAHAGTIDAALASAEARYQQGDHDGAMEAFRAHLVTHPDSAQAWLRIGNILQTRSDWTGAQTAYTNAARERGPFGVVEKALYNLALVNVELSTIALTRLEALRREGDDTGRNSGVSSEDVGHLRGFATRTFETLARAAPADGVARVRSQRAAASHAVPLLQEARERAAALRQNGSRPRAEMESRRQGPFSQGSTEPGVEIRQGGLGR